MGSIVSEIATLQGDQLAVNEIVNAGFQDDQDPVDLILDRKYTTTWKVRMIQSSAGREHEQDRFRSERSELSTVLASTLFTRAPELSRILRYVCEQHFLGRADTLKEYNIAVEALGRPSDFRPAQDSIVRVQAARLRKHLHQYYENEGARNAVQIRLSAVGYIPEFVPRAADSGEAVPTRDIPPGTNPKEERAADSGSPLPPPEWWRKPVVWKACACLAILGAGFAVFESRLTPVVMGMVPGLFDGSVPPAPVVDLPIPAGDPAIRIRAGYSGARFIETGGDVWSRDEYFSGGEVFDRPERPISRSLDPEIYQTGREGEFSYAIPLKPGVYEVHLHFAETRYGPSPASGADTQRVFDVLVNGAPALSGFDIARDAGNSNTAEEKVLIGVSPAADGRLHLDFHPRQSRALLNGIEILPGMAQAMAPVRIVCSTRPSYDRLGRLWRSDRYFYGGRISDIAENVKSAQDPELYSQYRTGNFNYAIPVAPGRYRVNLKFAEPVWGRPGSPINGRGRRVFDIFGNGRLLEGSVDVLTQSGERFRLLEKTFSGLEPNAQGKLIFSFTPQKDYAVLMGFEVVHERLLRASAVLR